MQPLPTRERLGNVLDMKVTHSATIRSDEEKQTILEGWSGNQDL